MSVFYSAETVVDESGGRHSWLVFNATHRRGISRPIIVWPCWDPKPMTMRPKWNVSEPQRLVALTHRAR